MRKILLLICCFACCGATLSGQTSRPLSFLEINPDARTAGMGDAGVGDAQEMFLFTDPSALLRNPAHYHASYTFGAYPKAGEGRQLYHAASAGVRFGERHAVLVGFRNLSGLAVPRTGIDGEMLDPVHPFDRTFDLGYACRITSHWSAFAAGSFIQSYNSRVANTGGVRLGVTYAAPVAFFGERSGNCAAEFAVEDFGGKFRYGSEGVAESLPTSVRLGGSLRLPLAEEHTLSAALAARYFLLPADARAFTFGFGLEYELFDLVSLRAGYHFGNSDNYFTFGLGLKVKFVRLDAAYSLAQSHAFNFFRIGASLLF